MFNSLLMIGLLVGALAGLAVLDGGQPQAVQPARKVLSFDNPNALTDWKLTGEITVDHARTRQPGGSSLKIAPGSVALLNLRDTDASGAVEMWVYDDATSPDNPKTAHVGPRWGLVQGDGRILAVGMLYAGYLAGNEGYSATANNGKDWFDQVFWLGINRTPAGWHKWTFDFDAETGLRLRCDDRDINVDLDKSGMKGFRALAIWGDNSTDKPQTLWAADVAVTLGSPTHLVQPMEADPYDLRLPANRPPDRPVPVYTSANAPAAPRLSALPRKASVSEYGITWTFDRPAPVGQFINGDWYVVGPVTITDIDPGPLYGKEIPARELDHMDKERPEEQRVRNGFMVNPPARMKVAYDSGVRNWFDPTLIGKLPVSLNPGDALVSTISMPKGLVLHAPLRNKIERGVEDSSPIRTAAVLTCVNAPQPADAFRPGFCDRKQTFYLARNLRRGLLPRLAATKSLPPIAQYIRFTQRPWVGTCFFGFEEPVENMPQYGLEYGRVSGISALLLCTDMPPAQKEPLLVNLVQVGIDLGGMVRSGHPGWSGWGGHGSGRKLPIVLAGLLLGDETLARINRSFPAVSFGEDEQTAYGDAWTGAKVVFAGHSGIDAATGVGRTRSRGNDWGPYEHKMPALWNDGNNTSESYRRCCTSVGWVAQALALRLLHAEPAWNHDAFFDYVDRWMYEDDTAYVKTLKETTGKDYSPDWARQGQAWDDFVNEMWARYRMGLTAPTSGWKQAHDESYYRTAIQKGQAQAGN